MKNRVVIGAAAVILGLLLAVGTQTIFPVCGIRETTHGAMGGDNSNSAKMKCYWTGRAEIGAGGVIAVIGVFLLAFRNKRTRAGLSLALIPIGVYTLLIPAVLIGVCEGKHMDCRALAFPAVTIIGAAVSVLAAANAVWLHKPGGEAGAGEA